jgi:GntR family transcriptional regulator
MRNKLVLSNHSPTPMYAQIVEQIIAKVVTGEWPSGHALPSIREFSASHGISVITVKRAYLELELVGVIVTQQGKGSFVANAPDASRALIEGEFAHQLDALLATSRKLDLSTKELLQRVGQALRRQEGK